VTIFGRILKGEIPAKVVFEDDQVMAFHDVNPQAPVHVLVIPKREIPRLSDTTDGDEALLGHLLVTARNVARTLGFEEDGYRVVLNVGIDGGQSVEHLHVHVLAGRPMDWPPG
jgi:histidine triad (HIT) family protein